MMQTKIFEFSNNARIVYSSVKCLLFIVPIYYVASLIMFWVFWIPYWQTEDSIWRIIFVDGYIALFKGFAWPFFL